MQLRLLSGAAIGVIALSCTFTEGAQAQECLLDTIPDDRVTYEPGIPQYDDDDGADAALGSLACGKNADGTGTRATAVGSNTQATATDTTTTAGLFCLDRNWGGCS